MWKQLVESNHTKYQKNLNNETYDELVVGTDDTRSVKYVAFSWTTSDGDRGLNQYFFRDDLPFAFNFGRIRGPGFPLNRPPTDPEYNWHFEELAYQVPNLKESLTRCIEQLKQPGPTYKEETPEEIVIPIN